MDGDFPDLPRFCELKEHHGAFLMVDEAHSLGVLGASGKSIREQSDIDSNRVDLWMGTMSKTLAGCGGFIAGCQPLVDMLRHFAPGFLYSVGLAPALAEASLAVLECLLAEPEPEPEPGRVVRLQARGRQFLTEARAAGLDTGLSQGFAVVPVITGSSLKAAQWANALFDEDVNVQPIFYPAVEGKKRTPAFFHLFDACAGADQPHGCRLVENRGNRTLRTAMSREAGVTSRLLRAVPERSQTKRRTRHRTRWRPLCPTAGAMGRDRHVAHEQSPIV